MSRNRLALWGATAALWSVIAALWVWLPSAPTWPFVAACAGLAGLLWVIGATNPRRPARRPPEAAPGAASVIVVEGGRIVAEIPEADAPPLVVKDGQTIIGDASRWLAEPYPLPPPVPAMITAPYPGHDHSPGSPPCPACLVTLRQLASIAGASVEVNAERLATPVEVTDAQLAADARAIMAGHDAEAALYAAQQAEQAAAMLREAGAPITSGPPCAAALGPHLCRNRPGYARECESHLCACGAVWGLGARL